MIEIIKNTDINASKMANVPTRPNSNGQYGSTAFTPELLKERIDALPMLAILKINEIIEGMGVGGDIAKTIRFKQGDSTYTLQELFDSIFKGAGGLSDLIQVSGDKSLNLSLISLEDGLVEEISRAEEKDAEIEADIATLRQDFADTVADIRISVGDAFTQLTEYANSLANEVTE